MNMSFAFAASSNRLAFPHTRSRFPHTTCKSRRPQWQSSLVAVAGATGGVGRLVVNRLLASIVTDQNSSNNGNSPLQSIKVTGVRALVRNESRAKQVLPYYNPALRIDRVSLTSDNHFGNIQTALKDVEVLIICTGTTAFPTRAWRDGNTPSAVDDRGVNNLVTAVDHTSIKRVVLLSSIGTSRGTRFPFAILNIFGTMDAKRLGEKHVQRAARRHGFSYAVVRPGRLVGGPHTNIGMVRKEPHPRMLDIEIANGDTLVGDLSRAAAADAVFIAAKWDPEADLNISLVHREGPPPVMERWESLLKKVEIRQR